MKKKAIKEITQNMLRLELWLLFIAPHPHLVMYVLFGFVCGITSQSSEQIGMFFYYLKNSEHGANIDDLQLGS